VLRIGGHDFVSRAQAEPADDDVNRAGRRVGERHVNGGHADLRRDQAADPLAAFEHRIEVRLATAAVRRPPRLQRGDGVDRRFGERPVGPRVQVRVLPQDRETGPLGFPAHRISSSTGAWSESSTVP